MVAWGITVFLDLHSTLRKPDMIKYETNALFSFLHSRTSWVAVPVQLSIEVGIMSTVSILTSDFFQTFGLACACVAALHAWCWRHNEAFRKKLGFS